MDSLFNTKHGHSQIKICVSGAAETGHCGIDALEKAKELGREIARQGRYSLRGQPPGFRSGWLWDSKKWAEFLSGYHQRRRKKNMLRFTSFLLITWI
ncbi:hypothetical protein HYZ82_01085 [Candidatus Nomurabacteria bacterium]|nr:hypothetical protein [Candidatus Nomurabacteria bacterium]